MQSVLFPSWYSSFLNAIFSPYISAIFLEQEKQWISIPFTRLAGQCHIQDMDLVLPTSYLGFQGFYAVEITYMWGANISLKITWFILSRFNVQYLRTHLEKWACWTISRRRKAKTTYHKDCLDLEGSIAEIHQSLCSVMVWSLKHQ